MTPPPFPGPYPSRNKLPASEEEEEEEDEGEEEEDERKAGGAVADESINEAGEDEE